MLLSVSIRVVTTPLVVGSSIPFAQPLVGNLRLRPSQSLTQGFPGGTFAFQVDNLDLSDLPIAQVAITVQRPAGTTANSKLPVIFWMCES